PSSRALRVDCRHDVTNAAAKRSLPGRGWRYRSTVYPDSVLRSVFETLHDTLDRPQDHSGPEANGNVDLGLRIIVVTLPLASLLPTNPLAYVCANCKQACTQLLRQKSTPFRLSICRLFLEEPVHLLEAFQREICFVARLPKRSRN